MLSWSELFLGLKTCCMKKKFDRIFFFKVLPNLQIKPILKILTSQLRNIHKSLNFWKFNRDVIAIYFKEIIPICFLGKYKCRESWPSEFGFKVFTLFLDIVLFVVPLIIMLLTYILIAFALRKSLKLTLEGNNGK